jgi:hypothetical protein
MKQNHFWLLVLISALLMASCSPKARPVNTKATQTISNVPVATDVPKTAEPGQMIQTSPPAPSAEPPTETVFEPSKGSQVSPDDFLNEVSFYGNGGGGPEGFYFCQNESKPTLTYNLHQMTQAEYSFIRPIAVTCGWRKGEQVIITVTGPGGKIYTENTTASEDANLNGDILKGYYVSADPLTFNEVPDDPHLKDLFWLHGITVVPVGDYQIHFEGKSGSVDAAVRITATAEQARNSASGGIFLFGFAPNDQVRIVYYYDSASNSKTKQPPTWQEYQVDSNGELWIKEIPNDVLVSAIFGQKSGYITTLGVTASGTAALKCGKALPTRTSLGQFLRLASFLKDDGLKLYNNPGISAPATGLFLYENPHGAYVRTISEPTCVGDSYWWKVQTMDNQVGWATESNEHSYFLIDVSLRGAYFCDSTVSFVIGQAARVTFTDGASLNLRQSPDFSAPVLNKIPEGTRLIIKKGPECGPDNTTWWYVETDGGISGWVVEAKDGIVNLEPWK